MKLSLKTRSHHRRPREWSIANVAAAPLSFSDGGVQYAGLYFTQATFPTPGGAPQMLQVLSKGKNPFRVLAISSGGPGGPGAGSGGGGGGGGGSGALLDSAGPAPASVASAIELESPLVGEWWARWNGTPANDTRLRRGGAGGARGTVGESVVASQQGACTGDFKHSSGGGGGGGGLAGGTSPGSAGGASAAGGANRGGGGGGASAAGATGTDSGNGGGGATLSGPAAALLASLFTSATVCGGGGGGATFGSAGAAGNVSGGGGVGTSPGNSGGSRWGNGGGGGGGDTVGGPHAGGVAGPAIFALYWPI